MSSAPPLGQHGTAVADPVPERTPDQDTFWTRYSPHHEFPLSSVASAAAHVLVGVLFIAIFANFWFNQAREPLPVTVVYVDAGGGGDQQGKDKSPDPAIIKPGKPPENLGDQDEQARHKQRPTHKPDDLKLLDSKPKPPTPLDLDRPRRAGPSNAKAFEDIRAEVRRELEKGLDVSRGKDGPGSGGGEGGGNGPGRGNGRGPGNQNINVRMQRVLRWTMKFNTLDGDDYRRQLAGLGAILALSDGQGGYLVIRDLEHVPAKAQPEDLGSIHRIFWIDNKPESVSSLAKVLDIRTPPEFIAFFPEALEKELLSKELEFRGRPENDIKETVFAIRQSGGHYIPVVVEQTAK
jgi:hypothetical protein